MRADARRNRERVLLAAEHVLASGGAHIPLDEIARRAGVGAGTVYRHFPGKDALIEAVVSSRMARMAGAARAFAAWDDAGEAFRGFFAQSAEWIAFNKVLVDALERRTGVPGAAAAKRDFQAALGDVRSRAQRAGAIRDDVGDEDVVALLTGCVAMIAAGGPADRMVALALGALRPGAGPLPASVTKSGDKPQERNENQADGVCAVCGAPLAVPGRGRPRRFCGNACRQKAHRLRARSARNWTATDTETAAR